MSHEKEKIWECISKNCPIIHAIEKRLKELEKEERVASAIMKGGMVSEGLHRLGKVHEYRWIQLELMRETYSKCPLLEEGEGERGAKP